MSIRNIIIISLFAISGICIWLLPIGLVWKIAVDVWAVAWIWITIEMINAPLMPDITTVYYPNVWQVGWQAWEGNTEGGCIGYGLTQEAAIRDLLEKMGEI